MTEQAGNKNPKLKPIRSRENKTSAIVFVHGFTGTASTTWDTFIRRLKTDRRLDEWDIFSIGYSSRLAMDVRVWTADPGLDICALGFKTRLTHSPLEDYAAVAVVAHSMGGLVVQRAVLDNEEVRGRISHVVLYGTPSGGLRKARFGRVFKRQLADMAEGGKFIRSLRQDWNKAFGSMLPFAFKAVAGSEDSFVPAESSLKPFPTPSHEVVPGGHIEIVHPETVDDPSYAVLFKALTRGGALQSKVASARLAVEFNDYASVVEVLLPLAEDLDDDASVTLALALEGLGRAPEAMQVIEKHFDRGATALDAIGVLAGRLKRRWLFSRAKGDYDRSLALYEKGLKSAVELPDWEQAYYHGINVAFLKLMRGPEHARVSEETRKAAESARAFAEKAPETSWSLATIAEASLMLGELDDALALYQRARKVAATIRAEQSMFAQALEVASRVHGEQGELAVVDVFEGA